MTTEARLLFLSANANEQSPISVDREYSRIKEALVTLGAWPAWRLGVEHQPAVEWEQIPALLQLHRPSIVHFAGHGYPDGSIELAKHDGGRERISTHGLAQLLASYAGHIRLVVLNACYSDELANALTERVDAVIGMTHAIPDAAATLFAPALYRAIVGNESVQAAFDIATAMVLGLEETSELTTKRDVSGGHIDKITIPRLRVRSGVDASQMRFTATSASSSPVCESIQKRTRSRLLLVSTCSVALTTGTILKFRIHGKENRPDGSLPALIDPRSRTLTDPAASQAPKIDPPEMVYVSGGTLDSAAVPAFWIAKTELSQSVWESINGANPSDAHFGRGLRYPVNNVTWDESIDTANKLSLRSKLKPCYEKRNYDWQKVTCTGYRLVTDFEWRYLRAHAVASMSPCAIGNIADRSLLAANDLVTHLKTIPGFRMYDCDDHFPLLAPVASLASDALGIYDREGNVAEWIWNETATNLATPAVRGNSFLGGEENETSHMPLEHTIRNATIGVRYARDAP